MSLYPLISFEMKKYYQKEPKFNGVCSRNNLLQIKDWKCLINLQDCKSIGTY